MSEQSDTPSTTFRLSGLRAGMRIRPGNEFWGCVPRRAVRTVRCDGGDLYIRCREGRHYLDGQVGSDGDILWGVEVISNG